MKHIKTVMIILCGVALLTSCNKWLDVKPNNQKEREDQYSTESGFRLALSGAYLKLNGMNLYGQAMTMTSMEYLAQLWTTKAEEVENFMDLNWEGDYAKSQMSTTFSEMYSAIYLLNDILIQMDAQGEEAIPDKEIRDLIQGEAFALRAFCHFDILRLFGPSPKDPNRASVTLPYSETASIELIPYYPYDTFIEKIRTDINRADSLLKQVDPVLTLTFTELNDPSKLVGSKLINDFQAYRQVRFNYWAVQAFKARMALYLGNKTSAYEYATTLINTRVNGSPVGDISQFSVDVANQWYTLPSETIFAVNCYNLIETIETIFTNRQSVLYKFETRDETLKNLFEKESADVRYINLWTDMTYNEEAHYGLKKYWQLDEEDDPNAMIYGQQIPIFRMSEMYLIAAECAPSLSEGKSWMDEFRKNRGLQSVNYDNQEQLNNAILKEYLKEFYAEGHMFFTYKRLGASQMIWNEGREIGINEYQAPLPDTEYTN